MATTQTTLAPDTDCPECGGRVQRAGIDAVCAECGLVVAEDAIDHGPDWSDSMNSRAKTPFSYLSDKGLGSEMGHPVERENRHDDLAVWHQRAKHDKKGRMRGYATTEIKRLCGALEVPDTISAQARPLFKRYHDAGSLEGQDLDVVAGACVLAVCRIHQQGVIAAEVATVARAEERPIARRMQAICRELSLEVPPPDVAQRVRVVAREAGIDDAARERALERVRAINDAALCRGAPSTIAAWLLWEESGRTQAHLSDAAGCSRRGLQKAANRLG